MTNRRRSSPPCVPAVALLVIVGCLLLAPTTNAFVPIGLQRQQSLASALRENMKDQRLRLRQSAVEEEAAEPVATDDGSSVGAQFGDVVARRPPTTSSSSDTASVLSLSAPAPTSTNEQEQASNLRRRNLGVAVASIAVALANYAWQWLNPFTPVQLLVAMQQASPNPVEVIAKNGKPTLVDFWAPWCDNCKLAAPTLAKVEAEYGDAVNFVLIQGDTREALPFVQAFGVDAIPHLALVSASGSVETALIGPVPKHVLEADLDVLVRNAKNVDASEEQLPYTMLDVFANRPEQRHVRFE